MDANPDARSPLIFIIAGEPSGDALAARLMAALKVETGGRVRFAGVGGERMQAEGLQSLFPMRELALMGIFEVLRHVPRILRRIRETVATVDRLKPDIVLTVDAPGFTLRVAKRLRGHGIPLVHYVAPTVWAWKPGRAREIAQYLDRLLVVLPFEPPYFEPHGLACDFVGHPSVEDADAGDGAAFRRRHGIPEDAPLLCALPGSRASEIRRLMPVYGETLRLLLPRIPQLRVVVPAVAHVMEAVREGAAHWPLRPVIVAESAEKHDAFAAATVALVKSGTTSIDVAIAGLPGVITQKLNALSGWLILRAVQVEHMSIINLLLGKRLQPEYIQHLCQPPLLAAALAELFENPDKRREIREEGLRAARLLGLGDEPPSRRAAKAVLKVIQEKKWTG
ncbi:MAG TPA: lipid-A-disaccharide synthase [Nevskiales bacterium]|nr:lipid-A-disaccharide synthase [Nevskiales bacterium]